MDPTIPSFNPFDFGAQDPANAPLPQPRPNVPLPEQAAGFLAGQNVTPQQFLANPLAFLPKVGAAQQPSLGGALEPQPSVASPMGLPAGQGEVPSGAAPAPGATATNPNANSLVAGLSNLKAPAPPVAQRVSTPNPQVPGPHGAIKGGNLIALLTALGGQVPTSKVPLGLGGQIGR